MKPSSIVPIQKKRKTLIDEQAMPDKSSPASPAFAENLCAFPETIFHSGEELFETIILADGNTRIERIVSHGHVSPEGFWYEQDEDEWVLVLEGTARIGFADGSEVTLKKGGHLLLPQHVRHRVTHTSSPCVWLAVFANSLRRCLEGGPK